MTVHVTYIDHEGAAETHAGKAGDSVMRIAVTNDVDGIFAECGGSMSCGTCHVFVKSSTVELPPLGEYEDEMLDTTAEPRTAESRLSCQLELADGAEVVVVMPEDQI